MVLNFLITQWVLTASAALPGCRSTCDLLQPGEKLQWGCSWLRSNIQSLALYFLCWFVLTKMLLKPVLFWDVKETVFILFFVKVLYKFTILWNLHMTHMAGCSRLDICLIFANYYLFYMCSFTYLLSPVKGRSFHLFGGERLRVCKKLIKHGSTVTNNHVSLHTNCGKGLCQHRQTSFIELVALSDWVQNRVSREKGVWVFRHL